VSADRVVVYVVGNAARRTCRMPACARAPRLPPSPPPPVLYTVAIVSRVVWAYMYVHVRQGAVLFVTVTEVAACGGKWQPGPVLRVVGRMWFCYELSNRA